MVALRVRHLLTALCGLSAACVQLLGGDKAPNFDAPDEADGSDQDANRDDAKVDPIVSDAGADASFCNTHPHDKCWDFDDGDVTKGWSDPTERGAGDRSPSTVSPPWRFQSRFNSTSSLLRDVVTVNGSSTRVALGFHLQLADGCKARAGHEVHLVQFSLQPSLATGNISISETGIISLTQQNSDFLPVELGPTFTVSEGLSVVLRAERSGPYVHYSVAWGEPLGTPRYVDAKTLSEADDTSLTVEVGLWTSDVPPECTAWYDNVWLDHH